MNEHAEQAKQHGGTALEIAGRAGYATKGVVYLVVGGLAAAAAWGAGGETTDSKGAVAEIGSQPFGEVLLWIVAIGLAGYCVWKFVQAIFDADGKGTDAKGIGIRMARVGSGITYALLAWTALPLSLGSGSDNGETKRDIVGRVIDWPGGKWLVAVVGLWVIGYGGYQIYKGIAEKYKTKYRQHEMSDTGRKVAHYAGKLGLTARGIVFGVVGLFVIIAAMALDPNKVKSSGQALDVLARQPYGAWVLLAVAIGLFCYGVFCLVQARYRQFITPG